MSDGPVRSETAVKRGQPKSRNGCITCKSKRRKCDETKPGCLRCRYYNITCGGYDQGIKWRPVKMSNLMRKRTQSNQPADAETEDTSQRTQTVHSSDNNDATAVDTDVSVQDTAVILQDLRSQRGSEPFAWDSSFISSSLDFGHIGVPPLGDGTSSHNDVFAGDVFDDLILDDFNQAQFDADALANLSFGHSPRSIDAGFLLPETPKASTPSKRGTYQVDALFLPFAASSTEYSGRGEQRSNDHDETLRSAVNANGRESESLRQSTPVFDSQPQGNPPDLRPSAPNFRATASNASPQRHETPDDTPEAIETLFNVHTCRILSIQTDVSKKENVDSLLGCSSTLFPLLSRLADLVGRARRGNDKLNSLDNISRATDLKVAIERWTPPIDVEASEDKSRIVDMIQTAEAYRWAAILLLRQTVPEVPWAHSQLELAQKTLVYLATIPRDSPTTVVHAFPLMVAGVEAIQEENRDWIRRRWKQMSKAFNMVVAERCQKLIEEVWRRRDDFEERHGVRCVGGTQQASSSSNEPVPSQGDLGNPISGTDLKNRTEASLSLRSISPNFPDSLAFKKGIDPVTRAGYTEYTVRGRLHFLEIMKEWQWQVMLA
ncbi:Fungal specific transcription factor domain-containing protein [Cladophialophora immunda]|nr:Fungal specific transcription factor domain-containing protein [Cladophialophora immunda]